MKKGFSSTKRKRFNNKRTLYALKRKRPNWKRRKQSNRKRRHEIAIALNHQYSKAYIDLTAPKEFSFVNNTNEVLKYFNDAQNIFYHKGNVNFDISEIENLTPDAIALLVGSINDKNFMRNGLARGNYPEKPALNELFTQSGFHRFVEISGKKAKSDGSFLHRERHFKVVPSVAQKASLIGIRHTFHNEQPYEPLYDILIECMSNTNNHATLGSSSKTRWWLYVYNDPTSTKTSYSFLDLGVGIFESIELQGYFQNFLKTYFAGTAFYKHINIVDDLLAGRIQSRVDEDNEIRGKGIPQIVEHSKLETFREFYIISNDVKINVKNGDKEELKYNFKGTFLYWEIQNLKDGNQR